MLNCFKHHKTFWSTATAAIVILLVISIYQVLMLHKAHSTFANYYAFRDCEQLVTKTPTYAVCKTASGKTITIVLHNGKWDLKGDYGLL
jgi:hypothetical protein